ncbi:MAG TPA: hypothetical protein VJH63_02395 [Candidatus Paceibacterota bacterium]
MLTNDPIKEFDKLVREAQESARKYSGPIKRRYPFLLTLLLTFGFLSIAVGFHLWAETIPLFHERPAVLILIGMFVLFLTGTLYKVLKKDRE